MKNFRYYTMKSLGITACALYFAGCAEKPTEAKTKATEQLLENVDRGRALAATIKDPKKREDALRKWDEEGKRAMKTTQRANSSHMSVQAEGEKSQ